jgi:hypothetical protein
MKLCELVTRGLRIPDRTYSFRSASGAAQPVVLITSPPAMGKTTLLRAIAAAKEGFAAYGPPVDLNALLRPGASEGRLAARWLLTADEVKAAGVAEAQQLTEIEFAPGRIDRKGERGLRELWMKPSSEPGVGKLELFPEGRRLCKRLSSASQPPYLPPIEDGKRLSADPDKYLVLARALYDAALAREEQGEADGGAAREQGEQAPASQRLAGYAEAVKHMAAPLRLASVRMREATVSVLFTRADGSSVGIEQLSTSEEQAVLFALVHGWRELDHSILLIDSPELGVHGAHHADLLDRLRRLGTDNQIIAATGSEALLRRAQPAQVIDVAGGDSRAAIEAARIESEPKAGAEDPAVGAAAAPAHAARRGSSPFGASLEHDHGGSAFGAVVPVPVVPVLGAPARAIELSPWTRQPAEGNEPMPLSAPRDGVSTTESGGPSSVPATPVPSPEPPPPATPTPSPVPPTPPAFVADVPPPLPAVPAPGIDQTGELNLDAVVAGRRALPFAGSGPPPASAVEGEARKAPADEARGFGAASGRAPNASGVDETQELTVAAMLALRKSLPFDKLAPGEQAEGTVSPGPRPDRGADKPKLSLEQYASFCAEMEALPGEAARILRDYRIRNAAERTALSIDWGRELEAKPELRIRFEELRKSYTEWLRSQRR